MNYLISGGSGTIGTLLARKLLGEGHNIWILSRSARIMSENITGITYVLWDGCTTAGWGDLVSKMDVVINLSGESLVNWPWTKRQMKRFVDSRVNASKALEEAIQDASPRPRVFIQASGINHYGVEGGVADESSEAGDDFLSRMTVAWEGASAGVEGLDVRRCIARFGVVLTREGGLFPFLSLPIKLFFGGRMGSGKQYFSWIHGEDLVAAICHMIQNEGLSGPFNVTTPKVTTNDQFSRSLARLLKRPYWLPLPGFVMKFILGEMSVLVLAGRMTLPKRLLDSGFTFQYPNADEAIKNLIFSR